MSFRSAPLVVLILVIVSFSTQAEITKVQFEQISRLCLPSDSDEGWRGIGWEIDLWAARERAAREGKPVFLWEMDGHPLGCT